MILVNGAPATQLEISDRGLQYGDGLFETIAVIKGIPQQLDRHLRRLQYGCQRLSIPAPDDALLTTEIEQLLHQNGDLRSVLKLMVTRGSGGRGYRPPPAPEPTRILSLSPWPIYPPSEQGIRARLCETRLGSNPALAGIKHLNRLEQVLARNEWSNPEIAEGVMMDGEGRLIEGTISNLFLVFDEEIHTPDLSLCGVNGVMRALLIDQQREAGKEVVIRPIHQNELKQADEVFCTNSLIGIWPVQQIDALRFDAPGPVTTDCIHRLNRPS